MNERYFLAQDNDAHWYIVKNDKRNQCEAWLCIPSDDARSWHAPEYVKAIGGSPSMVTFTDPRP